MSFGGGSDIPDAPPPPAPATVRILPEIKKGRADLRERLRRARSRRLSQLTTPGLLDTSAPTQRPALADLLSGVR